LDKKLNEIKCELMKFKNKNKALKEKEIIIKK
jgi:hypothetical protein